MYTVDFMKISARLTQWVVYGPGRKWVCTATDKATAERIAAALNREVQ